MGSIKKESYTWDNIHYSNIYNCTDNYFYYYYYSKLIDKFDGLIFFFKLSLPIEYLTMRIYWLYVVTFK
jgi:hypothetical protein